MNEIDNKISIYINKCSFDEKSIIFEIGPNKLTDSIKKLTKNSNIINIENANDINEYCKLNKINNIDLLYFNFINESFSLNIEELILNKTQYIICHANYIELFNNILDKSFWSINRINDSVLCKNFKYRESLIQETGIWKIKDMNEHFFDNILAEQIAVFLKSNDVKTIVDFGCGHGEYVNFLNNKGFDVIGFDGNPMTPEITNGKCSVIDLAVPFNLNKKFDAVLSLEVGEHIPQKYESIFINNLINHCLKYLIISWAIPGQNGYGHVNCQTNDYISCLIEKSGFKRLIDIENTFRLNSRAPWFKNTIMVFKKDDV